MSEEEPTYAFIRGVGWVPEDCAYPKLTWEDRGYRITLTERDPGPGDRFFAAAKAENLDYIKQCMGDWDYRQSTPGGRFEDFLPHPKDFWHMDNIKFVVVKIEGYE